MPVRASQTNEEVEASGEDELQLVALKYTGSRSHYDDPAAVEQGGYPSFAPFQQDQWTLCLLPSTKLGYWERQSDFEVAYDKESVAEAIAGMNYLPPEVFHVGQADEDLREKVFDLLDLEPTLDTEEYRENIADIAGANESEVGTEVDPQEQWKEQLENDHQRSNLVAVASELEYDGNAAQAKTLDLVDYLAEEHEEDRVRALLEDAEKGDL